MMSYLRLSFLSIVLLMQYTCIWAQQLPQAINFQGVARGDHGKLIKNTIIGLRLTIVDNADGGKEIYREKHADTTDAYGFFSLQVGQPISVDQLTNSVKFEDIPWQTGKKFLKIEFDTTASQSFPLKLGTIEMVTVPFAYAAESVTNIQDQNAQKGDVLVFDGNNWVPGKGGVLQVGNTSTNYAIDVNDDAVLVDASDNDVTLTLPSPNAHSGILDVRLTHGGNDVWVKSRNLESLVLSNGNGTDSIHLTTGGERLNLVSDSLSWYVSRTSSVHVKGSLGSQQPTVLDVTYTPVPIGNEITDNYNAFNEKTGRFTCPKGQSGQYQITVNATLDSKTHSWDQNEFFNIYGRINGNSGTDWSIAVYDHFATNVPYGRRSISGSTTVGLNEGDFLDLLVYVNLGGVSYHLRKYYLTIDRIGE